MKRLHVFLFLFALLGLAACDDDDSYSEESPISRDLAYEMVKMKLFTYGKPFNEIDIYATKDMLPANTPVIISKEETMSSDRNSWLFFIDEIPLIANWGHPCKYIFVDAFGNVTVYEKTMPPSAPSLEKMDHLNWADIWDEWGGIYYTGYSRCSFEGYPFIIYCSHKRNY